MVTIQDVYEQASKLATGDLHSHSVKLALWFVTCSIQQDLDANGRMAEVLAPYANTYLPDREELANLLRSTRCFFMGRTLDTLYYVEYLERAGKLDGLEHIGNGYASQLIWRERVIKLVKGHGLSYKTVSMAAMLLDPLNCELVPIDRHVLSRLDMTAYVRNCISANYRVYCEVEQFVLWERDEQNPDTVGAIHHWYKWEEYRQSLGISKSDTCETHEKLSVRK